METSSLFVTRASEPAPAEPSAETIESALGCLRFSAVLLNNSLNKELYSSAEVIRFDMLNIFHTV